MATIDATTPAWLAVQKWAQGQLEKHRAELEKAGTDHDAANLLRGRIDELKELLALPSGQPRPVLRSIDYGT